MFGGRVEKFSYEPKWLYCYDINSGKQTLMKNRDNQDRRQNGKRLTGAQNFCVYISGKISGLGLDVAKSKFKAAEIALQERGFLTINPFDLNDDATGWKECMINDIAILFGNCDGIFMLNNWRRSRGARIERIIAQELGLFIAYQK